MAKENNYNVLSKPVAKRGRNSFNLNNQHVYSQKAGQIIPVKATHFMPGDFFKMKVNDFSITFPMNAAPFLRMRKEFSFYSVYYSAVWSLFNQYMAQRQDPKTSAFGVNPKLQEPRIKTISLFGSALSQFSVYVFLEHVLPMFVKNYVTINELNISDEDQETIINNAKINFMDDLDSSPYNHTCKVNFGVESHTNVTCSFIPHDDNPVTYDPLGFDCFAVLPFEYTTGAEIYNRTIFQDVVGNYRCYDYLRKLDMLGYGNYYPYFNQTERLIADIVKELAFDHAGGDIVSNYSTLLSQIYLAFLVLAKRLVNSFTNYDRAVVGSDAPTEAQISSYKMVNLYPICAYNSIFYHFFRNSYYDNNYLNHDYSLDFVSATGTYGDYNEVKMSDFSSRFLDIEYHQWKKDMFTSVLPDEQFGAVSSIQFSFIPQSTGTDEKRHVNGSDLGAIEGFNDSVVVRQNDSNTSSFQYINSSHAVFDYHTHSFKPSDVSFDMIALKRAEMLQEYRQTLMRAGNKTSDVFRALYGGAPSSEHLDDIIPRFLETFGVDLVVDPVVSTANTEQGLNGKLGDISARAKGSGSSKVFKFDAGDNFGCILTLCYVVPTSMYNSYMMDKHLFELTPEQHFIPNFENCGLEDVYTDELNMLLPANDIASLGKQARYYHKKTDVDKVHGAFCSASSFKFSGVNLPAYDPKDVFWFGEFNHWISARTDMQTRHITTLRDFYINPSVLDNIFVQASGADQSQDQFICTTLIETDATKQISKVGMVNFV